MGSSRAPTLSTTSPHSATDTSPSHRSGRDCLRARECEGWKDADFERLQSDRESVRSFLELGKDTNASIHLLRSFVASYNATFSRFNNIGDNVIDFKVDGGDVGAGKIEFCSSRGLGRVKKVQKSLISFLIIWTWLCVVIGRCNE